MSDYHDFAGRVDFAARAFAKPTERTDQGEQHLAPGVAPITDRDRLESAMRGPIRRESTRNPKPAPLLDDSRAQQDLGDLWK